MKKIIVITSVVFLAVVGISCTQNKPEPVVEKYYTHFYRGEFDEIQNYVMEEQRPFYDFLQKLFADDTEEKPHVKVTDIKCKIDSDTAAACTCTVDVAGEILEQTIQLAKVKNDWLVNKENVFFSADPADNEDDTDVFPPAAAED